MALTEIPGGPRNFGAARFLVRNGARERDAAARLLRPLIQELPERLIDPAEFPQPGRRGPSRSEASFPGSRERREETENIVVGEGVRPGEPGTPGILSCAPLGGFTLTLGGVTPALTNDVNISNRIPYPFMITHIQAALEATFTVDITQSFFTDVTPSNDPDDRFQWRAIIPPESQHRFVFPTGLDEIGHHYPNFIENRDNSRIKLVTLNNTVAARVTNATFDIVRLA